MYPYSIAMSHNWFLPKTLIVSVLLPSLAYSQVNAGDAGVRSADAFQSIQPANTTILSEYGYSPPVYPSRKSALLALVLACC